MRIENEFVYDDEVAVTSHPYIGINNNTLREDLKGILTSDFWGQNIHDPQSHKSYRPLVSLFFYFEHKIYSTTHKASYMKRWTMVFHALLCCLLNFLLKRIFRDHHMIKLAVLLFSVHPIHVEAIGSVVGRADVMCALGLLGFIAHYFDYIVSKYIDYFILLRSSHFSPHCILCSIFIIHSNQIDFFSSPK